MSKVFWWLMEGEFEYIYLGRVVCIVVYFVVEEDVVVGVVGVVYLWVGEIMCFVYVGDG